MPFGQLIFGKIIKIVASRGHLLWLKCIIFYFFGWAPEGAYIDSPDPLALRGLLLKGERRGGGTERESGGMIREWKGEEEEEGKAGVKKGEETWSSITYF